MLNQFILAILFIGPDQPLFIRFFLFFKGINEIFQLPGKNIYGVNLTASPIVNSCKISGFISGD